MSQMMLGEPRVGLRVRVWRDYWWPFLQPHIARGLHVNRGRIGRIDCGPNSAGLVRVRWECDSCRLASAKLVPLDALLPVLDARGKQDVR